MSKLKIKKLRHYVPGYSTRKRMLALTFNDVALGLYFAAGALLIQLISDGLIDIEDLTRSEIRQTMGWIGTFLVNGLIIRNAVEALK